MEFLVGAFRIKEPDSYSHCLFETDSVNWIFVQFVQLKEYLENASKLVQTVPFSFCFLLFNVTYKTGRDWKIPFKNCFSTEGLLFEKFSMSPKIICKFNLY